MATSSIRKRINNLKKVTMKQPDVEGYETPAERMSAQIDNYKTRATAADIDLEEATDTRNPIEKLLNLPEDQNVLFDVFDIIGRPQQALFGGIKNAQEGKDVLEGVKEGISGEKTTYFGDILRNAGIDDSKMFTNPITKDDVSAADLFGVVGDIALDPVDLALWASVPATGGATAPVAIGATTAEGASAASKGAKAVKAAKVLDTATDAAKAIDTAGDIAKAGKLFDTTADVAKGIRAADRVADTTQKTKLVFKPFAKDSKSILELAMGGAKSGTKKLLGLTDTALEKGLKVADTRATRDAIQQAAENAGIINKGIRVTNSNVDDILAKLTDVGVDTSTLGTDKLNFYRGLKNSFNRTKNYADSIPADLYNTTKRADNELDMIKSFGDRANENLRKDIGDWITKTTGKAATDADIEKVGGDIQKIISARYAPENDAYKFLNEALRKGKNTFSGSKEEVESLKAMFDTLKGDYKLTDDILNPVIKYSKDGATLTVKTTGNDGSKLLADLVKNNNFKEPLSNIKFKKTYKLSDDAQKEISKLNSLYDSDNVFKGLVDSGETNYRNINKMINEATGGNISFEDMLREGYVTNAKTPEGALFQKMLNRNNIGLGRDTDEFVKSGKKAYGERKLNPLASEANKEFSQQVAEKAERKAKQLDNLKTKIHENDLAKTESSIAGIKNEIKNSKANFSENLEKLNKTAKEKDELVRKFEQKVNDISDIINDEVIKKASKVSDDKAIDKLLKKSEKYNKSAIEVDKIKKALSKKGLTDNQVNSLTKKLDTAYSNLDKTKVDLITETAKVKGAAEESFIKEAGKIANKMSDKSSEYTRKAMKAAENSDKVTSKIRNLNEAYNKQVTKLETTQRNLEIHLEKLKNMTPSEIEVSNKIYLDRISSLQKDIDLLNSFEGKKLFNESYFQGFGDFVNKTTSEAKTLNTYNEALLSVGLNDDSVIKFVPKGENAGRIPAGYTRLSGEDAKRITNELDSMKNFLPDKSPLINELKSRINNSSSIVIDKGVKDLLVTKVGSKEISPALNLLDKYNSLFKKAKTVTPGTQLRNITGNMTNMYLSGVPLPSIATSYAKANKISKSDYILSLMDKSVKGTLSKSEKAEFDVIKQYVKGGFLGQGKEVQDLGKLFEEATKNNASKNVFKKAWDKMFEISVNANEFVDNRNRMALLIYSNKNPKYLSKIGAKDGIDAVKKVLFDPSNMSPFEMNYVKKAIPFYTFAKQNLIFQANNMISNTSRYNRLFKTFKEAYGAAGEGSYNQYQKENMEIPLFKTGDDNLVSLKANLPVSDLGETLSNPLQKLVNMESPLIKTPIEQVTGVDSFTGNEINRTTPETIASLLGIDTLTTAQAKKYQNLINDIEEESEAPKYITDLLPSMLRYTDSVKIENNNMYDELQQYQNIFKNLKDQGIDIPTMRDLSKNSKISLTKLKKARKKATKNRR